MTSAWPDYRAALNLAGAGVVSHAQRDTLGYRCGLRQALTAIPSVFLNAL